jgi:ketosteroid isomerase-like protein
MKSTSLPYCNEYIGRFTVHDGKIVSFMEYLDPIRFVIAIGGTVNPPPGIPGTGAFDGG